MKVVLADSFLAPTANDVFDSKESLLFLDAWMGVFAFSGQIFLILPDIQRVQLESPLV